MDNNVIRQDHFSSHLSFRVVPHHDLNFDAEHTLAHEHVANRLVNVMPLGLSSRNEVAISEFHCLGALCPKLATDDDLDSLAVVLHDEAKNAVACAAHSETTEKFVSERFCLSHGTSCTILNPFGKELHTVLWEIVTLLHHRCELTNATALVPEHLPGFGGSDDDLSSNRCDADLHTGIAILGQGSHQEFVQLSVEDTISDKLALLGDLSLLRHLTR
mmetsp:Transcript_21229/g.35278  ORF Transcript_21229/g.35278 Transcript_21229/m.35278 type:complete len:217 (-) Transcript_21229:70-720(-)